MDGQGLVSAQFFVSTNVERTSSHLSISLQNNTGSEIIENESLVDFSDPELPRQTSVLYTRPTASTSTSIVTGYRYVFSLSLSKVKHMNNIASISLVAQYTESFTLQAYCIVNFMHCAYNNWHLYTHGLHNILLLY